MKKKRHSLYYKKRLSKRPQKKTHAQVIQHLCDSDDTVIIYQSELDYISRCILDYRNIETGGQLFGFYTSNGIPIVCYAIGPGRRANHQVTFFNQDKEYLVEIGERLLREYGLQHIGEWHSHHQLGLDHPSGHDIRTVQTTIDEKNLGQFLLCIGTCTDTTATIHAFNLKENSTGCESIRWSIKAVDSPYREKIDAELCNKLLHPMTMEPSLANMRIKHITIPSGCDQDKVLKAYKRKAL